jgi:predicted PurR-regulated permease PerM
MIPAGVEAGYSTRRSSLRDDQDTSFNREQIAATFVEVAIRFGALTLLLYFSLLLISPFVSIIIWSVVLTVALYPPFEWLAAKLGGRRRLAAALITILSLLVVIGPVSWLAFGLIESLRAISERLDLSAVAIPAPSMAVKEWPLVGDSIYQFWELASTNFGAAFATIAPQLKPLGSSLLRIAAATGIGIIEFLVSIVVAGFLFSPAPSLVTTVKNFSRRLSAERGEEFVGVAGATIRAVSRGVIGVSVLQAILAGIGLMAAGIPQTSLITFAVLIFGIVQIGASVVLIPVIIWSWFSIETSSALLLTAFLVPVSALDNILKPIVMGRGLKTPMLVILIGVIGGTLAFGITGLFLGPIVLAVIWELLFAWIGESAAR